MPIRTGIFIFNIRILEYKFSIIFALLKLMKINAMIQSMRQIMNQENMTGF